MLMKCISWATNIVNIIIFTTLWLGGKERRLLYFPTMHFSGFVFLLVEAEGGGHSTFFLVGMCGLDFWTWGLVSRFLSKTGALELISCKIFKLFDKNCGQIWASGAEIVMFKKKNICFGGKCHIFLSNVGLVNGLVPQHDVV